MARDWRRLFVAATATAALVVCFAADVQSQAQKAPAQDDDAPKAPKKKKQDPVEAQRAVDAALKQLEAGKADQAVGALSNTLTGGNLPPAVMAKALLYRGIAYRQQKKPAQAIADLTSALWLKGGLGETDRKDALRQRTAAYQEAGLTETGEAITPAAAPAMAEAPQMRAPSPAPPPPAQAPMRTASTPTKGWGAETSWVPSGTAPAPSAPQTSQAGGWDLFGNLFGGWGSSPAQSAPRPPAPAAIAPTTVAAAPVAEQQPEPVAPRRQPEPRAATSAWSSNTEVQPPRTAAVVTGTLPAARAEGRFRIQVGIVRTQDEAEALAARIKQNQGALLGSRDMEIDQTLVGNMGSFYRVRVGPFATQQETNVICARLKESGVDCLVLAQ